MKKENKGITLIALIVTIIVMLILVTVTVSTVIGNGGIFTKAQQGKIQQTHAQIKESFVIEQGSYMAEKTKNADLDFITYLRNKDIIDENNVINVEKLVGQKLSAGNGTFEKHKDIYVIESETTSVAQATQVASLETVQIAKASTVINYNIVYYDKNGEKETIGTVVDLINKQEEPKKMITFKVRNIEYTVEEGTTWAEFCETEEGKNFYCSGDNVYYSGHNIPVIKIRR